MNYPKPNIFRANKEYPYHLSVGAVVVNEVNEILCHHFNQLDIHGLILKDLYLLMRESIEVGETLEQAVARGLSEEFGVVGEVLTFLGGVESHHRDQGYLVYKSTLYFLVKCINFDPQKRLASDPESGSKLAFYDKDFLISKMNGQGKDLDRTDLDESEILRRI